MLPGNLARSCAIAAVVLVSACQNTDPVLDVVGSTELPTTPSGRSPRRAFIWSEAQGFQVIPLPPGATSMDAVALNNVGQLVGYVTLNEWGEAYRAFSWSATGGLVAIGSLVGPDGISMALSIDGAGNVMGLSEGPHAILSGGPMGIYLGDAFIWNATSGMKSITSLDKFPGYATLNAGGKLKLPQTTDCARVVDVNDSGQAIGYAGTLTGSFCEPAAALLWDKAGDFVEIGDCGTRPGCLTSVSDINNLGEVVGEHTAGGFRWTLKGGFKLIPIQGASVNFINDDGDAVGFAPISNVFMPILWKASGDIKKIQVPAGATYEWPVGISDKGVVAGNFQ